MDSDLEHKLQFDAVNLSSKLEGNKILLEKEIVVMDHDDDGDWMLIEGKEEGQETNVANKLSWKRWIMDKTSKSFGIRDKMKIKASSH